MKTIKPEKELSLPPPPVIYEDEQLEQGSYEQNYETRKYWEGLYRGMIENGKREGKGTMIYLTGEVYYGNWSNDMWNGYGRFITCAEKRKNGKCDNLEFALFFQKVNTNGRMEIDI